MKRLFLAFVLLALSSVASAATIEATLDWAGTDSSGAVEASMPCTITIHDAANDAVLSSATLSGPVTGYAMPSWTVPNQNNAATTLTIYAKAVDAAGNESAHSDTVSVTIPGVDTLGPCTPIIKITVK
jgi:hypothetical protein